MNLVLAALARHGAAYPECPALADGTATIGCQALHRAVLDIAAEMRASGARAVGLAVANGPAWIVADLAALAARMPCVPVPPFFSAGQQAHLLRDAGVDCVLTDDPQPLHALLQAVGIEVSGAAPLTIAGTRCTRLSLAMQRGRPLGTSVAKVTYTSGTTGAPKGVCLGADALDRVAQGLATACELRRGERHSSLLPLSTLLENVAVYAHLVAGGCCVLRPLPAPAGACGGVDGAALLARLAEDGAATAILVPEMLRAAVQAASRGTPLAPALRLLAVGGAPVSPRLIAEARRLGLPVYEGYGLSECASVVSLNTRLADKPGTVGRPLKHAEVKLAADGEVLVRGALFDGYLGGPERADGWYATGDRGALDGDGFLRLTGRGRNIFITSHGRNVSPEWVESELTAHAAIAQAWVWGEARPWNAAVVVPGAGATSAEVDAAIAAANEGLPDYARVRCWVRAEAPFAVGNGQLTRNGRLRREALVAAYAAKLERLYEEDWHDLSR